MRRHQGVVAAIAMGLLLEPAVTVRAQTSAAELARQSGAVRQIEARFAARVAAIVGLPVQAIIVLLPSEPRIADRGRWLSEAIRVRHRALDAHELEDIATADAERRAALAALRRD